MSEDFVFATIAATGGNVDVIFIHGLTGDPVATWTSSRSGEPEGDFWPKWLAKDVPGLNLYSLGYPASIFAKWAQKEMALHEQAIATLDVLAAYELGERPIALITHSLGGLLAKQLIRFGLEARDPGWNAIARSCRLVVFLGTPHTGSSLASILEFMTPRLVSDHVALLESGGHQLDDLNQAYRNIAQHHQIETVVYYEKHKTKNLAFVVEKRDADPGVGSTPVPVQADHLSISKPTNRSHQVYLGVSRHLKKLAKEARPMTDTGPAKQAGRDYEVIQALQKVAVQGWLTDQLGGGGGRIKEKIEAGVFDPLNNARKKALAGRWEGQEKQSVGPDGGPIEYPVFVDIAWDGNVAKGSFRFVWSRNGTAIVDETLPFEGGFLDRFLLLNFQDSVSGKIQFGSLFLELSEDGTTLRGVDVGVGYTTKKIVIGDLVMRKTP
jgi:hypothetical protein